MAALAVAMAGVVASVGVVLIAVVRAMR